MYERRRSPAHRKGVFKLSYHYYNEAAECMRCARSSQSSRTRLRAVVKRVYENVPFYKKKFDEMGLKPEDIRSIEDLTKLPFTQQVGSARQLPL